MEKMSGGETILFQSLMKLMESKMMIIVTFIAILELAKNGILLVSQSDTFQDIRLKLKPAA
jgi:chromatin segregation and condensation protein Rec8/ScpA/Scc1 (kleisin family)